ncbi:unnamed protein product, partial [Brassica rapa subsp. trilocularis]
MRAVSQRNNRYQSSYYNKSTSQRNPHPSFGRDKMVDRSYRPQRAWDNDNSGHREPLKRSSTAQPNRPHQSEKQREGRWVETGRRLQTSSRSNERELSRNDSRLSSSRRASREEVNTPFNEHMREYQAQPDIGHAGEKEKHPTEPKDQIPEEIMAEAREELREVMIQYTSIADPSESAARKERLRRAEEQGEVDESAEQIARQLMRDQKTARGGAIPKQTQTRIPVTQRLGPSSPLAPQVEVVNEQLRIPAKKRLGRPSTKKPLGVNTAGTRTSTKRRVAPVRTSPIRKQS